MVNSNRFLNYLINKDVLYTRTRMLDYLQMKSELVMAAIAHKNQDYFFSAIIAYSILPHIIIHIRMYTGLYECTSDRLRNDRLINVNDLLFVIVY